MMPTETLRAMLDERGVEWEAPTSFDGTARYDTVAGGYWFHEFNGKITIHGLDPEQAIAATLGSCNCPNNCTNSERTSDELGRGTCHVMTIGEFNGEGTEYYDVCSNCGYEFDDDPLNYCPSCGRKVMSA